MPRAGSDHWHALCERFSTLGNMLMPVLARDGLPKTACPRPLARDGGLHYDAELTHPGSGRTMLG